MFRQTTYKSNDQLARKLYVLCRIVFLVAVLTSLIAFAATAQMTEADQPSGRTPVMSAKANTQGSRESNSDVPFFLPAVTSGTGGTRTTFVTAVDLNGDDRPDLLVGNRTCDGCKVGGVGVLLNNGDGTFPSGTRDYGLAGAGGNSIAVADMDGDGKADMLVANECSNAFDQRCETGAVIYRSGNGDGTFARGFFEYDSGGNRAISIAIADFNGDGKPDVVVANECVSSHACTSGGSLGVLLGNGDATFQPVVTYGSGGYHAEQVLVADVNGDGKSDLIVVNECATSCQTGVTGSVSVLLGNGDGTFQPAVAYGSGGFFAVSVAVGYLNRDRKLDLVVANLCADSVCSARSVGVLRGNGNGTFQPAGVFQTLEGDSAVAVADVNGDGNPDLVLAGSATSVLFGIGDGTFGTETPYDSGGVSARWVAVADLNGDGRPDIVAANRCVDNHPKCNAGSVGVLMNNNGPHSATATALGSNVNPAAVGQLVVYTATVTNQSGGQLTGTVAFAHGRTTTRMPLVNHQAMYTASYNGGAHAITATYSGDANNATSTSDALTEYVGHAPTQTILTTSGSPSQAGQPVTFIATIGWKYGTVPDGELVTFFDGVNVLGTDTTVSGAAKFNISSLIAKTHKIKATYAGDATFKTSSGLVTQVVEP